VSTLLARSLVFDEGFYRRDFVADFGKLFRLNGRCRSRGFFDMRLIICADCADRKAASFRFRLRRTGRAS